jgi:glycosyltransferase involved in cell wall biosynthesis
LHIITEGDYKDNIERALPHLPQAKNMHFYYNPFPEWIREMCEKQDVWRFYRHYKNWQKKTYAIALDIIANHRIDIVHQLNMIGFREPGYLWKIANIPFVWGPVDAKEKFPVAYLDGMSQKQKLFIQLKNVITKWQLRYSFRVKNAVRKASYVVSASTESVKSFHKYFNISSPLINETGCYSNIHHNNNQEKHKKETFDILWVGQLYARKQLALALKTIAKLKHLEKIKLHVVGGGDTCTYQTLAESLNISDKCCWYGLIPHQEVQKIMQTSNILFFTSVAEGTPHAVLEAISNCLPVVCFDCCGQGDSINEKVGVKISLSNPQQSIDEFASKIEYLYNHREVLEEMSKNCILRQQELSWENKAKQMIALYNQSINQFEKVKK